MSRVYAFIYMYIYIYILINILFFLYVLIHNFVFFIFDIFHCLGSHARGHVMYTYSIVIRIYEHVYRAHALAFDGGAEQSAAAAQRQHGVSRVRKIFGNVGKFRNNKLMFLKVLAK